MERATQERAAPHCACPLCPAIAALPLVAPQYTIFVPTDQAWDQLAGTQGFDTWLKNSSTQKKER